MNVKLKGLEESTFSDTVEHRLYDILLYEVFGWSRRNSIIDCSRIYSAKYVRIVTVNSQRDFYVLY
jgi:hypothetical protein